MKAELQLKTRILGKWKLYSYFLSFQSPKTMSATLSESSPRVQSCSPVTNPEHQTEMAQISSKNSNYFASILSFDYTLLLQVSGLRASSQVNKMGSQMKPYFLSHIQLVQNVAASCKKSERVTEFWYGIFCSKHYSTEN